MNKTTSLLIISSLIATLGFSKGVPLTEKELAKLNKNVTVFKRPNITVKDGIDEGKYYFLQLSVLEKGRRKNVNAFLDKDSGAVYIGHRYDQNGKKASFPMTTKNIATIKKGISFSYGKGKDLYIVTDPECPYCIKFEKQAKGKLDDYRVHVILYPLSFHKEAPAMVEWIMQGKDDAQKQERLEKVMIEKSQDYKVFSPKKGQRFQYSENVKTKIDNANQAAKVLGAKGTPSVYTASFKKISWGSLVKEKVTKLPAFKSENNNSK